MPEINFFDRVMKIIAQEHAETFWQIAFPPNFSLTFSILFCKIIKSYISQKGDCKWLQSSKEFIETAS